MGLHEDIEEERNAALPEAAMLKSFRQYARGRQRGTVTAAQSRILRGVLGNIFCDNVCAMILTQLTNRLTLARFEVSSDSAGSTAAQTVEQFLRTLWTLNHIPTLAHFVHWATFRDGNHAVAASWVDDRVVLTRERWWNGLNGIFVAYDDYGRPTYAFKDWDASEGFRRVVWYEDRIERYIRNLDGWRPYRLPSDGNQWPVPWVDAAGAPLGLPIVHFANLQIPNDADGDNDGDDTNPQYGMSELDGGILGLQDEINDVHRDISANARFAGYQMLYGTGITPQTDEEGNEVPFKVEPGAFFEESNDQARFGVLPPGSQASLAATLMLKLQAVGRMSSVPMHLIGGDWPSGEAILRAERSLIDKIEAVARFTGPAWSSVAHIATKLANVFGLAGLDDELLVSAVYVSPERRDALMMADYVAKVGDRLSEPEVLRLLNYSPDQIQRIMQERKEDSERLGPADRINVERAQAALERDRQPQNGAIQDIRNRLAAGQQGGEQ